MSNMDAVLAGRLGVLSLEQKVRLLTGADFWSLWPEPVAPAAPTAPWPRDRVAAELRAGAAAGFVLARNADVDGAPALPLERTGLRRVAVLGSNAEAARTLGGGSATVFPPYTVSPLQGLRATLGPGTHVVGASGLGRIRLTVAGRVAHDGRIELPPGADPVEGIMRPPQRSVTVDLRAGQEVPVVLRHEPEPSGGFGDAEIAMVTFQLNVDRQGSGDEELDRAVALAGEADAAVVVVGTTEEVESEGFDRDSLALPGRQDELVGRVAAVNQRTIVVVNAGAPVLLPWREEVSAVLFAWFPGQEFGNALADVLLGATEPGGRLPVTWPADEHRLIPSTRPADGTLAYDESIRIGHRAYERAGVEPAYWFGHGLGYTAWEYLDAEVTPDGAGGATVRARVRNRGRRAGREVVQVYASRPDGAVEPPTRWLVGFAATDAGPGEEATVDVAVPARAFAHWDSGSHRWRTEPGAVRLAVGRSSHDQPLALTLTVG